MPLLPCKAASQKFSTPVPRGVTAPVPVTSARPLPLTSGSVTRPDAPSRSRRPLRQCDLLGFLIGDLHPELLLELHDELHQIQRVSLQILPEGSVGCDVAFINSKPVGGDLLYLAEYLFAIQDFSPLQGSYRLL